MTSLGWIIAGPFIYLAVAVLVGATAYRVIVIFRMPRQLRWDLYPLPHRGAAGSKYQQLDFHKREAKSYLLSEVWEMALEILFIKRLFRNNPRLWVGSYAMHTGIYLGVLWVVLLIVGAVVRIASPAASSSIITGLFLLIPPLGGAALVLGLGGSIYLLLRRYFEPDLRTMSDRVTFLNLGLMIALFGSALAAWLVADGSFRLLHSQVAGLITFHPVPPPHPLVAIEFFFFGLFLMYLPFSRMLHFAAKYFFYHRIMWDDESMMRHGKLERERFKELAFPLQWAAPHIKTNRSWLDQVNDRQAQKDEKNK
jgi:nitrate reductase gamma subunit